MRVCVTQKYILPDKYPTKHETPKTQPYEDKLHAAE